eukprot:CAMPEP_0204358392 /NCGR_PEP_ID=MMETSP0469-20131031/36484_1 /ASSEMBLY_ACC=CAM_ASM_000384 /TAXON_ID=2969 /ORGANISM="Oxyrrhis marina" /LENGTH=353 /DNA_ID=CAMNT_0051346255 /DNA_START=19 /DNA_END=1080 /DNA_ORIENTATION=-
MQRGTEGIGATRQPGGLTGSLRTSGRDADKGVAYKDTFGYGQTAIPGYRGFVPGKNSDTVFGGTFRKVNSDSQLLRQRKMYDPGAASQVRSIRAREGAQKSATGTLRMSSLGSTADQRGGPDHHTRHPAVTSGAAVRSHAAAGDFEESRILDTKELRWRDNGPRRGDLKRDNIVGYTGFVPGRHSENVFANTWTLNNSESVKKHKQSEYGRRHKETPDQYYGRSMRMHPSKGTSHGNEGSRQTLTAERTVVPAIEADKFREIPIFNPSYQDRVRGTSTCEFSGKGVDPAGRQAPVNRQDGTGLKAPPAPLRPHGYAGYVQSRGAENVIGERQCKTDIIAMGLHRKNKMQITQR